MRQVVAARKFLGLLRRLRRASAVQTLRSLDAPRGGERSADSAHRRVGAPQTARTADRAHRRVCAPQIGRTAGLGAPQTECAAGRTLRRQNVPQGGRSADSTGRSAVVIRRQTGAPQADGRSADWTLRRGRRSDWLAEVPEPVLATVAL